MKNINQQVSFGLLLILSAFALGYTLPKTKEQFDIKTKIVRTRTRTRSRTRTDADGTTSPGISRSRFYISEKIKSKYDYDFQLEQMAVDMTIDWNNI